MQLFLQEKRKDNTCNGSCAGIQYFRCAPGHGVFTTVDKIIPKSYSSISDTSETYNNIDLDRNAFSIMTSDGKPKYEEIVTKYGEYPRKLISPSKPSSTMRNSLSLQNMLEVESKSVNTNNDFDQNTVIQPDKTYLVPEQRKIKTKSEMDLIDVIGGSWAGTTDSKQLENFSNLKKHLDKNDNIKNSKHSPVENGFKEKYTYFENGIKDASFENHIKEKYHPVDNTNTNTLSRRNKSLNPLAHLLEGNSTLKKNTAKFYTDGYLENNKEESRILNRKQDNTKSK